jgi:PAS domain S-box-containing protein
MSNLRIDFDLPEAAPGIERYSASILECAGDAIVTIAADQRIVLFNAAAETLFRCPAAQAIGVHIDRFIPECSHSAPAAHHLTFAEDRESSRMMTQPAPISGLKADGEQVPIEASLSKFKADGQTYVTLIIREVSHQRRVELALAEHARRLKLAQRLGGVAVWGLDVQTGQLTWEPEMDELYGVAPGTIRMYADWVKRVHPQDLARIEAERDHAFARGEPFHSEFRIRLDSGEERWLAAQGRADCDETGQVQRVLGINVDITARKATETALAQRAVEAAEREEALFALARATPSVPADAFRDITRTAARLLRVQRCGVWLLSPDEQKLESACLYLADEDRYDQSAPLLAALFPDYFRQLRERKVVSAGDALQHPATRAFTDSYLKPLGIGAMLDAPIWRGGRLAGVLCHEYIGPARTWTLDDEALASALADHISRVLEAHDRLRAEDALRESESRLRLAIEAAGIGTYIADLEQDRVRLSAELAAMLGVAADEEITVEESLQVVHPDDSARARAYLNAILEGASTTQRLEVRVVRPGGAVRWLSFSGHVEHRDGPAGRAPQRLIGACIDITDVKSDHEQITRLNADLEKRVAERTTELADTNHQLTDRTLQLRRLALELTRAEERERRRIAQVLHDQLQQLLVGARLHADMIPEEFDVDEARARVKKVTRLIDESIKASRSLTDELSPPVLHLAGLVEAFRWLARWMEQHHQLGVQVTALTSVEPDNEGVSALLFRCVRELLFNVVKHSGVNAAGLTIERVQDHEIRLTVADQGRGFDPAEHHADRHQGFGLFSIRERLRLLGGRVSIESEQGCGTTIVLEAPIPRAVTEPTVARAAPGSPAISKPQRRLAAAPARIRVLLVDDHKILREGLRALLQNQPDIEVVGEASDGYTALTMVNSLQPDVILMDINMPGLDGIETTRIISADFPGVRVIGLSMHGASSATAMREAGAVDFVNKGARADEMLAAVRAHAPDRVRPRVRRPART